LQSAVALGADIINNSWGIVDSAAGQSGSYQHAEPAWREAMSAALTQGRQGRGAVVVMAAGNGGLADDSNRDGYANHPGVLAVTAVDHRGRPSTYGEPGANILVSAPSAGPLRRAEAEDDIWTTDIAGPRGLAGGTRPYGFRRGGVDAPSQSSAELARCSVAAGSHIAPGRPGYGTG
jgi:subtilisin family serine protease